MGQVIARKIKGMNLWAKVALTVLFTLTVSVFMYEGWLKPNSIQAATRSNVVNYLVASSGTNVGTETTNLAAGVTYTLKPGIALTSTTSPGTTSTSTRPAGSVGDNVLTRWYSPVFSANAVDLTAITAAFNVRTPNSGDAWTFHIYDYDPSTGNRTLIAQSNTINNLTAGTTTTVSPTYTLQNGGRIQQNHRAVCEVTTNLTAAVAASGNWRQYFNFTTSYIQWTETDVTTDTTPPTVTINQAGAQADPTSSSPINFTVVFSESVSNFATGDVTISGTAGGTKTATVTGSGTTYNVAVSGMTTSGTVIASIGAGVATDAAGNGNTASTSTDNTVTWNAPDTTPPTVTINQAGAQADPTSSSPINFTVVFSESVSNFATGDVTISGTAGGTKTATVTGSGTTYNVAVSGMTTSGTVIASIGAGVATDAAGNGNTASTSTDNTVTWNAADTTPPTVTINQDGAQADPTSSSPINFTVVFSESVSNFATGDVTISGTAGGTKTATVTGSGTTYNVAVSGMTTSGTVIATIGAGVATDAAGNGNTASTSTDNTVTWNAVSCTRSAPTVSLGSNGTVTANGQKAYTLTVTNNDTAACSASTFALSIPSETGNTASFVLPSVLGSTSTGSVAAQGSYQTTFTVRAQASATLGHTLTSTVQAADATNHASQTGSGNVTTTVANAFSSDLMHNATNLNSTYRGGSWGNDKDCTWCHSADTTNVKRIATIIQTLEGPKPVVFNRMTSAVHNVPGVMGDDQRTYAQQASTNVCEVCHHNTTYHQYSGSKVGVPVSHASHPNNNKDCTNCHAHKSGFKADCSSCHGFPPTVTTLGGPNGLASPATLALGASPTNAGAHAAHDTLGMLCATCHNAYATGVSHPSTSIQIDFSVNNTNWPGKFAGTAAFGTFSGNAPTGGSPAVASSGGTTLVRTTANNTNNSCNVYCHGNWPGANGNTNPRWAGGSSQSNCGTCHGASAAQAPQTGSHAVHASSAAGNYGFNCSKCHTTVASGADGHVNGSVQWRLSTASTLIGSNAVYKGAASGATGAVAKDAGGNAFGDCTNIYCHSNGLATGATYQTVTWGVASEGDCGTCHGVLSTAPPASAAHAKHVATAGGYLIACATCHFNVANTTANSTTAATIKSTAVHVNKVYDAYGAANFNTAIVGSTATSCQTTYCHSQGTGWTSQSGDNRAILAGATSPTWSSAASCSMCHTGGTTTGPTYTSGSPKANSHAAHTSAGYTCDVCHYATTTTGTTITTPANHANRVYNVSANTSKTGAFTYTYAVTGGSCANTYCHGSSIVWGSSIGGTGNCDGCHSDNTATTSFKATDGTTNTNKSIIHVSHINMTHGISTVSIACADCHTYPGVASAAGHIDSVLPAEVPMNGTIASKLTARSFNPTTKVCTNVYCHGSANSPDWDVTQMLSTIADCDNCHGLPPTPGSGSHASIPAAITTIAGLSACSSLGSSGGCHPDIAAAPSTYANIFSDKSLHIDGTVQGGNCVACHSAATPSSAPKRIAAAAQFNSQSHHVQGRAVTPTDCYQCHWEANSDGSMNTTYHGGTGAPGSPVDLVIWNSAARPAGTTYTEGTTGTAYTANGTRSQIAKINNQCLSCHSTTNAAVAPFVAGSTTDKYSPEARLATPKPKTSILSRYSSTITVPWSIYNYSSATGSLARFGTNQKNRTTKALSAHGNAVKNQMPAWSAAANGPGEDGNMTDYTVNGKSANRNVLCYDCHNSHGSAASGVTSSYSSATGRYKGGLLKTTEAGLGGYATTYTPATTTVSYRNYSSTTLRTTATFNPGANICNDCHNSNVDAWKNVKANKPWDILRTYSSSRSIGGYWSTPYFDNYTVNSTKRSPYKAGRASNDIKDMRHPMGGHYGSSINGQSAAASKTINGLCTPCHDPHGVSKALGTDRDHGVPLLKGTWVTSPYREDKADALVVRGGGRNAANFGLKGAIPGYHIDQNTFMTTPAPLNGGAAASSAVSHKRAQRFRSFSNLSSAQTGTNMPNLSVATFGGLCLECHNQTTLTGSATRPSAASAWRTKERVHQSVAGWSATASGTDNLNNRRHAFTCAKCHTPHVSRLPRLMVTNCLDARHYGKQLSTTISSVASGTTGNGFIIQSTLTSTALGAGRFPGGGSRYSGTPGSAQNPGGWWFQTNGAAGTTQPSTQSYGSNCHNSATAGGATYSPVNQMWNNKTRW